MTSHAAKGDEAGQEERPCAAWTKDMLQAFGNGFVDGPACMHTPDGRGARVVYLRGPDGRVMRDERKQRRT